MKTVTINDQPPIGATHRCDMQFLRIAEDRYEYWNEGKWHEGMASMTSVKRFLKDGEIVPLQTESPTNS